MGEHTRIGFGMAAGYSLINRRVRRRTGKTSAGLSVGTVFCTVVAIRFGLGAFVALRR